MASPFVHLEVLGPRARLDEWLGALQDHGGCHVADALEGLGDVAGLSRPDPTAAETQAAALRYEALRALSGVEDLLPARGDLGPPADRPAFSAGALGEGGADVEALAREARDMAGRLRRAAETVRSARTVRDDALALSAGLEALESAGHARVEGRPVRLAGSAASPRALLRRLAGVGARAVVGRVPGATTVVVLEGDAASADAAAAALGARPLAWPEAASGRTLAEARPGIDGPIETAQRALREAEAVLTARVHADGARARLLLDAARDAEARAAGAHRLASTAHVAAARLYVRREDAAALHQALGRRFGREVVLRELAEGPDEPSLPRAAVGLPFGALEGLRPSRQGEVATASLLALAVPLAVGLVWGDVGGGLLLLAAGALLGAGAGPASPRRDTALLGELAGLLALLAGLWRGRAFGALGERLLGTGWGLGPPSAQRAWVEPLGGLFAALGVVALLAAAWGALAALWLSRRGQAGRSRAAVVGALHHLAVAGALAAGAGVVGGDAVRAFWAFAPVAALGVLLLAGPRGGLARLALDAVAVVRLVAVALFALVLVERAFAALADPSLLALVLGPAALLVGTLAVLVDPAHVAMGVPYDLSLGGRGLAAPFTPLGRHLAGARSGRTS